ncbi:hypothetical protein RB195_012800 [Necator americanus]|uniref:SWIM-type domain-containing protein n=1 Tax=Necator americanus TaxID=51031 RepID=A0ABR1DSN3_NECAM
MMETDVRTSPSWEEHSILGQTLKSGWVRRSARRVPSLQGDGKEIDSQEVKQRYKSTKRVHKHCPCFAKVRVRGDNVVEVTACFGHMGHNICHASFPLSSEDELTIKSMLVADIPPHAVYL